MQHQKHANLYQTTRNSASSCCRRKKLQTVRQNKKSYKIEISNVNETYQFKKQTKYFKYSRSSTPPLSK